MRYQPPSIKTEGLTSFLNTTSEKHQGYNYKDFVKFIQSGVNITNIARAFSVSRPTAVKWLDIHKQEQAGK